MRSKDRMSASVRTTQDCVESLHLLEELSCRCRVLHPFPDTAVTRSCLGHVAVNTAVLWGREGNRWCPFSRDLIP